MGGLKNDEFLFSIGQIGESVPLLPNMISTSLESISLGNWSRFSKKVSACLYGNPNFQLALIPMKIGVYPFFGSLPTNLKIYKIFWPLTTFFLANFVQNNDEHQKIL